MRQVSEEVEWSHYMEQLLDKARSWKNVYKLAVFYVPSLLVFKVFSLITLSTNT